MVDDTNITEHVEHGAVSKTRKVVTHRKSKKVEPTDLPDKGVIYREDTEKKLARAFETLRVALTGKKKDACEKIDDLESAQLQQQETTELPPPQQITTAETEKVPDPSLGCQYGFGYLSSKDRGTKIPDSCIECPDSLNCMLSKNHKSGESVKQISKWYQTV